MVKNSLEQSCRSVKSKIRDLRLAKCRNGRNGLITLKIPPEKNPLDKISRSGYGRSRKNGALPKSWEKIFRISFSNFHFISFLKLPVTVTLNINAKNSVLKTRAFFASFYLIVQPQRQSQNFPVFWCKKLQKYKTKT